MTGIYLSKEAVGAIRAALMTVDTRLNSQGWTVDGMTASGEKGTRALLRDSLDALTLAPACTAPPSSAAAEESRADFEDWYKRTYKIRQQVDLPRNEKGRGAYAEEYISGAIQDKWVGWQAAREGQKADASDMRSTIGA